MSKNVIIIGSSGHGKVIADIVIKSCDNLLGFLDDNLIGKVLNYPILGTIREISQYIPDASFIIGIGNNATRKKLDEAYQLDWYTAIHPSAIIAIDVIVSPGTVIMANAVINTSVAIGRHCIINTGAIIEHDNEIGDYVHISPNATLCGTVKIGSEVHIGAGATLKNNISVADRSIIGVGAVVVNDITTQGVYVGLPAKEL